MIEADPLATFGAIADPVRVEIIDRVAAQTEVTVTELAAVLPMTRQGVARHLKQLEAAGLLVGVRVGRSIRYRTQPGPVSQANRWLQERAVGWESALTRLAEFVEDRDQGVDPPR